MNPPTPLPRYLPRQIGNYWRLYDTTYTELVGPRFRTLEGVLIYADNLRSLSAERTPRP